MTNVSPSVKEALPNVNHFISPYKWKKNKKKRFFFVFSTNAKIYKIRKNHTELVWIYPLTGRGEQPISGTVRCMFPHENSISWKKCDFSLMLCDCFNAFTTFNLCVVLFGLFFWISFRARCREFPRRMDVSQLHGLSCDVPSGDARVSMV